MKMRDLSTVGLRILARAKIPINDDEDYCTINGRFVHRKSKNSHNTACGALPKYYTTQPHAHLDVIEVSDAVNKHVCGKCWTE